MRPSQTLSSQRAVIVPADGVTLRGDLVVPERAIGIVLFAHGSGSGRFSPRNRFVASVLQATGCATLLFDLLTDAEAADRVLVFDIGLLATRLRQATRWLETDEELAGLPVGYFGASTGAAAALVAAAESPAMIRAVVSRGGRPDLAGDYLPAVEAPTLFIVGGADTGVVELNEGALKRLRCTKKLEIIPGATHLFEEPGALEEVSRLAADWFALHLASR